MNSKIKNLLKTTAAVATLLAGSQTWGSATITGEDGTNYGTSGRDMKGIVTMNNTSGAASTANFTTAAGTVLYYTQGASAVNPTGNWTFGKGTKIHLTLTDDLTMAATFTSSKGDSTIIADSVASTKTLTLAVDQSQFALKVLDSVILSVTGALSIPVEIAKNKTLTTAVATSITGKISGEGSLTLAAAVTKVSSDLSGLKGTLTTGAADVKFTSSLASFQGTLALGANEDLSVVANNLTQTLPKNVNIVSYTLKVPAGTIKKVTSGGGTVTSVGDLVIEELDISGGAVTLGGNITIKKVTGNSNISLGASGNVVIHGLKGYTHTIDATAGGKISFQ